MPRVSLAAVVFVLLLSVALAQDANTCNFGNGPYPPQPNKNMPECCWYRNSTCCSGGAQTLFKQVQNRMADFKNSISDVKCMAAVGNFMCMFCSPSFGTYIRELGPNHYALSISSSFCSSLFATCDGVQWGNILPEKPATSGDLCKVLFETQVQTENNGVMYSIEIIDTTQPDTQTAFGGASSASVLCSGCLIGSTCRPSNSSSPHPPPHSQPSVDPPPRGTSRVSMALTVGIVVLSAVVLLGALAACRYMWRAFQDSRSESRRGRDFYPSTGEGDNESLNG